MDNVLRGNTDIILHHDAPSKGCKKRAFGAMIDISNVAKNMAAEIKETNKLGKQSQRII